MKKKTGQNRRSATKAILHGKHTIYAFIVRTRKRKNVILI